MNLFMDLIQTYGLWAVFATMLLESIGLPLPAYPILLVAAALMPPTTIDITAIILTGTLGTLLGDFIWFFAGKRYGSRVLGTLCKISISPDSCTRSTTNLFSRYGAASLTFVKFIPGLSTLAPVIAGAYAMPLLVFSTFITIGATIYLGIGVAVGVIFRDAIGEVIATIEKYGPIGMLMIVVLLVLYLFLKWVQRYRLIRQFRMDRVTVEDLNKLLAEETRPVILDVRQSDQRLREGSIPGSILVDLTNLNEIISQYSLEKEVVIYCSCPNEITAAKFAYKLRQAGFQRIRPLLGGIEAWVQSGNELEFLKA